MIDILYSITLILSVVLKAGKTLLGEECHSIASE